jgi:hypothetical protein
VPPGPEVTVTHSALLAALQEQPASVRTPTTASPPPELKEVAAASRVYEQFPSSVVRLLV